VTAPEATDTATDHAPDAADREATNPTHAEPAAVTTELADNGAATNDGTTADNGDDDGGNEKKAARLAPGALRGMVEDHLRDHLGDEFGPTAIAKALASWDLHERIAVITPTQTASALYLSMMRFVRQHAAKVVHDKSGRPRPGCASGWTPTKSWPRRSPRVTPYRTKGRQLTVTPAWWPDSHVASVPL
jgi:hypothetical protein